MSEYSKKLYIRKNSVITPIKLYDSISDVGANYITLKTNGVNVYAKLVNVTDANASSLRIKKNGTVYSVATTASIDVRLAECTFSSTSISYLSPSSFSPDVRSYSMNTFSKTGSSPMIGVKSFADIKLEVRLNGRLVNVYDIPKENYGMSYLFTINASNFSAGTSALALRTVDPNNSNNNLTYNFTIPVTENTGGGPID